MTGTCADCGRTLYSSVDGLYREVTGWARHREGEGGGINAISLPAFTGQVRCRTCMDVARGKYGTQLGLFT